MELKQINEKALEKTMENYKKAYMGEKNILVTANWAQDYTAPGFVQYQDIEEEFKSAISLYNVKCEAHLEGFDNIPMIRIVSGCATWTMAMAYGCEMVVSDNRIGVKHIIEDAQDAYKIKKLENVHEHGVFPLINGRILEFQRRYGNVLIGASDNQSPNDILTEVVSSETAMIAMYDEPETMHYLLDIFTESDIEINKYQQSIINNYSGHQQWSYLPFGIFVADDNAAFLSPNTYEEFAKPYNERLAKEFGGVSLHCCMKYEQNLKLMGETEGFMAFDPQTDFNNSEIIIESIRGKKAVWNVNNAPWQKNHDREYSDEVMLKNAIDLAKGNNGMIIDVWGDNKDEALKLADKIREYANK